MKRIAIIFTVILQIWTCQTTDKQQKRKAESQSNPKTVAAEAGYVSEEKQTNQKEEEKSRFLPELFSGDQKDTTDSTEAPEFLKAIYISNFTARNQQKFEWIRSQAKKVGINGLVIDVQPRPIPAETLQKIRSEGFYVVARVVNFQGGMTTAKPDPGHLSSIQNAAVTACKNGFPEIQLDYIRYADGAKVGLNFQQRYNVITGVIQSIRGRLSECSDFPDVGADIFGRIPFNSNDPIGQNVGVFSKVLEVLYPMLYPSHFYGMPYRIKDPYHTIYDGVKNTYKRLSKPTRVIPWIQGFDMSVRVSGLTMEEYIQVQMEAAHDSGAKGYVVWNAKNEYGPTFSAATKILNGERLAQLPPEN